MPVQIASFEDMSPEDLRQLRQRRGGDPAMQELLDRVAAGRPQRVTVAPGQSLKGLRIAIARKARDRGLQVETIDGDGFVAVWLADAPPRKGKPAPSSRKKSADPATPDSARATAAAADRLEPQDAS